MNNIVSIRSITKLLSSNDIGLTGGHQSGILVPKRNEILSFFPSLDKSQKNPRYLLTFYDDSNQRWEFSFIYYNNALFGGTRNEYRLTRMTKYIRSHNLKVGDELFLSNDENGVKRISCKRSSPQNGAKLKLSTEWKIIPTKSN
jgi:hypothetical protein